MKQEYYIKKWLEGTLTDDEQKLFEVSEDYKSLLQLSNATTAFKAPEYDVETELARLQNSKTKTGKEIKVSWLTPLLKVAAVLFVAFGLSYFFFTNQLSTENLATITVEKESFYLPDSSRVILNTDSELKYLSTNWEKGRQVALEGEAYFKVSKGSKFEIQTNSGTVSVLGTEFNVKAREGYFEVVCYEGAVRVETALKTTVLKPSQMLRIINGKLANTNSSTLNAPSWVVGESSFVSVPVEYVLAELERQYGVEINKELVDKEQLFTGRFTHNDINLALMSITIPLDLAYQIVGKQVNLKSGSQK